MKKIYFLALAALGFAGANAQNFNIQILDQGGNDVTNGFYAVPLVNTAQGSHTDIKFTIRNNGNQPVEVRVRRENVQMPAGFNNTICVDGFCYPATSDESNFPLTINAGAADSSFYGTFNNPNGTSGDLCVTYTIFNTNDETQFVTVRAYFGACLTASVAENTAENIVFSAFPNPASGLVTIKHNLQADGQLMITDITGKIVKNQRIVAGSANVQVDISDLRPGVYVYSLQSGSKRIISKKLVVR
jgi:hypothetical protein